MSRVLRSGRGPAAWYAHQMSIDVSALRRHYRTHGFVTGVPVVPPEEAARLLSRIGSIEEAEETARGGAWPERNVLPGTDPLHPIEAVLQPLVRDPRVLAPVRALLGDSVLLRNCDIFIKSAASTVEIGWHTDTGRIGRGTDGMLSLWLALTPATRGNGALEFVSGSHIHATPPPSRDKSMLSLSPERVARIDSARVVCSTMPAGCASLHHFGLSHRSGPNGTDARRVAVVMRFMAPWVSRWSAECGRATLVCGEDGFGKYELEERFPVAWTVR